MSQRKIPLKKLKEDAKAISLSEIQARHKEALCLQTELFQIMTYKELKKKELFKCLCKASVSKKMKMHQIAIEAQQMAKFYANQIIQYNNQIRKICDFILILKSVQSADKSKCFQEENASLQTANKGKQIIIQEKNITSTSRQQPKFDTDAETRARTIESAFITQLHQCYIQTNWMKSRSKKQLLRIKEYREHGLAKMAIDAENMKNYYDRVSQSYNSQIHVLENKILNLNLVYSAGLKKEESLAQEKDYELQKGKQE